MTDSKMSDADQQELPSDIQAYLAKIRETVKQSEALIETAELRMAETDRFLAERGVTRDDVKKLLDKYSLTPEQRKEIDAQLEQWEAEIKADVENIRKEYAENPDSFNSDGNFERRTQKLQALKQQFRL